LHARKLAILAIDEGTSGTRAALVAADGSVCAVNYTPLVVATPRHNVVEQDADLVLQKTLEMCAKTIASAHDSGIEIAALAIATQRATGVLWDKVTGRALVPAMVWQDSRYAEVLKPLAAVWDGKLVAQAGRPVGGRAIYLWAARHISETPVVRAAWQAGRLGFGTVDSWLLWNLSEDRSIVTTPTNATSAGGYNLAEHRYLTDWIAAQDFPLDLLPELKQDADDFGYTRKDILGIRVPIKASCGDQLGGLVGLGCHEPGQAMCVHGTGSFVDLVIGNAGPRNPALFEATFTMTAWRRNDLSHFAVETYAATTGSALNWLCNEMRWFEDSIEISALAATVSSSDGLCFIPTLTGLRQPRLVPEGRAALTGLSMAHSRAHLAHAILEGIAHAVVSCAEASAAVAGIDVLEVVAGGGLSSSDRLLQLQADLSGVAVRRMADQDRASLRGAAFLAGSDGSLWSDLAEARGTLQRGTVFAPAIGAAERKQRRARWHAAIAEEAARVQARHYQDFPFNAQL